jgi:hypothetical protein
MRATAVSGHQFFFFSYEGQRLRLPQVTITDVPDVNARETAKPELQPFLSAFPLPTPNTPDDVVNGIGQFNASYPTGLLSMPTVLGLTTL